MTVAMDTLMEEAREAIVKKDSQVARRVLRQITRIEPNNYRAWLWLAGVTDAPAASLQYVKRAAAIAPNDERVVDALEWAEQRVQRHASQPSSSANRVIAVDKFAPQAEIEEVRKPVNPWLRRLGIGLLFIVACLALLTLYRQSGLISSVPEAPVVAIQSAFIAASTDSVEIVASTDSEPLVAIAAQPDLVAPEATATEAVIVALPSPTPTQQKKSLLL